MKKMSLIFVLVPLLVLVSDCSSKTTNSESLNNVNQLEQVTLHLSNIHFQDFHMMKMMGLMVITF